MSEIETLLIKHNVRPTAIRILIYKFMAKKERAIALTEIEQAFVKSDRATLSRTIKTFETNGIVHQIDDGTGIPKYALCETGCNCELDQDLHIHFHCTNCDETVCLTDHKIPHINLPEGYMAENVNLVVKGICEKCSGE
ncbi:MULTISPECIES: Fur family transcriptional regulator [Zunongwangia]|uniref:Putative transcription regulator n=1 Tax=Zunongwangia atlantica 22II14-10F7 TaxID=1185767 RepID=A0A1Y1SZ11_9FLAO|nr:MULTISPECIES: transcriptional repressor [Zunongwangia]MCC4228583.1 transcriptional repressor [Zunongwangia profunda]ORL44006.1 putative transcription regulator [Zunongwangia atlantica 22II14-10F7]